MKRIVSGIMLTLLLINILSLVVNINQVKSIWTGTVYIRADGSIDPPDAPIITYDYITYTLTDNITSIAHGIVVERDNIIIDGVNYTVEGTKSPTSQKIHLWYSALSGVRLRGLNVTIINLKVKNFDVGIFFDYSSNNILYKNMMINNTVGVYLWGSSYNSVYENFISKGLGIFTTLMGGPCLYNNFSKNIMVEAGFYLYASYYSIFSNNIIINSSAGIQFTHANYRNLVSYNRIQNCGWGICLHVSDDNIIYANEIINCVDGIYFVTTSNNIIYENTIMNCSEFGIHASGDDHVIYHNNFINNALHAIASSTSYTWDDGYPSGGNYWSGYSGVDLRSGPYQNETGSDGIGDSPYIINENNIDRYPLMNPYGAPPTSRYYLTIEAATGGTTNPPPGTYAYAAGSAVKVTAFPNADHIFDHWELDMINVGSANPYTVLIDNNHTLKAVFIYSPSPTPPIGTIYIRADGSIEPFNAPIVTFDNITYTLTADITSSADGIVIERDSIIIDGAGFMVRGSGAGYNGIVLIERSNVTITNVNLKNFFWGIKLYHTSNCNITINNITSNGYYGIALFEQCSNNSISRNCISDNICGIYLYWSSGNSVLKNNVTYNMFGVELSGSCENRISENIFVSGGLWVDGSFNNVVTDNLVNGKPLIYLEGASDMTVEDGGQVVLVNCYRIKVENLNISKTSVGVLLSYTDNSTITNNNLSANHIGIEIWGSYGNAVFGNNITNNYEGISIFDSSENIISRNNIIENWWGIRSCYSSSNSFLENNLINNAWGIDLYDSPNNVLKNNAISGGIRNFNIEGYSYSSFIQSIDSSNTINGNPIYYFINQKNLIINYSTYPNIGYLALVNSTNIIIQGLELKNNGQGILLANSHYVIIRQNKLIDNYYGIYLFESSNNSINGNIIANNSPFGIYLRYSSNNTFCHNNFIGNPWQVLISIWDCPPSTNNWDEGYLSGGNYWSDYSGVDADGDGIGDTPYVIDENNVDRYPLMAPFGGLTLTGQNVTSYPSSDVCLIFENVTNGGLTTVNVTNVGPEPPSGFKLAGNYYDIKTTANYTGTIRIRIIYDDSNVTEAEESGLRLMQWDETLQWWIDITTFLDIEYNVIYGETSHLSIFAIVTPTTYSTGAGSGKVPLLK